MICRLCFRLMSASRSIANAMPRFIGISGKGQQGLCPRRKLVTLAKAKNKSTNGGSSIPATFLRVTVSL
jgi:hypothetical protein